jgi:hypothetical protein
MQIADTGTDRTIALEGFDFGRRLYFKGYLAAVAAPAMGRV